MKFHREGYTSLAIVVLFVFAINAIADYYDASEYIKWFLYFVSAFLLLVILQFFRSPKKHIVADHGTILCPSDGKVVVIEETQAT